MKEAVATNPINAGLFGEIRMVFDAYGVTHLIEQFFLCPPVTCLLFTTLLYCQLG